MDTIATDPQHAPSPSGGAGADTTNQPPTTAAPRLRRPRVATLLLGGLVACAVAVVEIAYRLAPYPSDQMNYFNAARVFPLPSSGAGEHQFHRLGLIVPMRLAQELFGYSQTAYLLVPMLAGVILAVSVYLLGVLLFGHAVGLAAVVLTIGNSLVFPELTQPLPDLLATALTCAAVTLAVGLRQRRALVAGTTRRQVVTLLGIGVLLAWSYLAREYIVVVWPVVPLLLVRRIPLVRLSWVALPLVVTAAAESAFNAVVYGDPLARLHVAAAHGDPTLAPVTDHLGHSPQWYFTRLLAIARDTPEGVWLKTALIVAVVGALFHRRIALLVVWALLFYVPITLLGGALEPDDPMLYILKVRYWLPLVPAMLLAAVATVHLAVDTRARAVLMGRRHAAALAVVVTLAVAAVPVAIAHHARTTDLTSGTNASYAANGGTQLEQLRGWLTRHSPARATTIWADRRAAPLVALFATSPTGRPVWNGPVRTLVAREVWTRQGAPRPARGDLVVFYSRNSPHCVPCAANVRQLLGPRDEVPSSWRPVYATADGVVQVYRIT